MQQSAITDRRAADVFPGANQYTDRLTRFRVVPPEFQNALASAARVFERLTRSRRQRMPRTAAPGGQVEAMSPWNMYTSPYNPEVRLIDLNLTVKPGEDCNRRPNRLCEEVPVINLLMRFYDVIERGRSGGRNGYPQYDKKACGRDTVWYYRRHGNQHLSAKTLLRKTAADAAERGNYRGSQEAQPPTALLCVCRRAMIRLSQKTAATCRRGRNSFCA